MRGIDGREDFDWQKRGLNKLLSAVVALAIRDAQIAPIRPMGYKTRVPCRNTITALHFLFTDASDGYLSLLDIDPQNFRKKFIERMYSVGNCPVGFDDSKRRNFRYNYNWYCNHYSNIDINLLYSDRAFDKENEEDK